MKYSRLIEVDINDVKQINVPCIVQGSINENLQIKLRNNGKVYNLTCCKVIYEIIKPDNNICSGVVDITVPNSGFGIIQLTKQTLSCVGLCKINLSILSSNKEIKVNGLKYEVTPGESEVISWSENLVDLPVVFGNNTYNAERSTNKWYDFVGDPDNSIGIDGDYALQLPKGDIWKKQQGYWERCGNIKGEKGEPGVDAVGTPGKDGVTPNFTIGQVSTVESGNSASVTITGTLENPILNLNIPKGDAFTYEDFTELQLEGLKVKGDKGSTWYDGVGRPVVGLGNDKDYYLNTSNYDIYTKINSIWERIGNIRGTVDDIDTSGFQKKTDNSLETIDKTIVGAINEVNRKQGGNIDLSDYATKEELSTKADKIHNHSNYSETNHNHNEQYATKSAEHSHINRTTLDKVTEEKLNEWNNKSNSNHNHDSTYSKKTETYNRSEVYTKGETDEKISQEIANAQLGGNGEVDLSAYATKEELKGKADVSHTHSNYSETTHNHNSVYATLEHSHEGYASSDHNHNTLYAVKSSEHTHTNKTALDKVTDTKINEWNGKANASHTHDNYSETTHNHDSVYAKTTYVDEKYNEVFQSVSSGKQLIASAITDKGVETSNTDTFEQMATNISSIQSGGGSGSLTEGEIEEAEYWKTETDWSNRFSYDIRTKIPKLKTSHVVNMSYTFADCYNLTRIEYIDTTSVTDMTGIFYGNSNLTYIRFNPNAKNIRDFDISMCTKMTKEDIVGMFESLPTISASRRITLGSTLLNKLTEEDKLIATNKGYMLG